MGSDEIHEHFLLVMEESLKCCEALINPIRSDLTRFPRERKQALMALQNTWSAKATFLPRITGDRMAFIYHHPVGIDVDVHM